ncbi:MAG: cell division protein FtsK, partial [Acidimicrobiales bacterium]
GLSPRAVPPLPPGRAVWVESGLVAQVALPPEHLCRCRSELASAKRPVTIDTLPANVAPAMLPPATCPHGGVWQLPIGIGDDDLAPIALCLHPGEHALVAGPARSGRTTALRALASAAARSHEQPRVVTLSTARSPVRAACGTDPALAVDDLDRLAHVAAEGGPTLVLIDDAEAVDDAHGALAALLAGAHPDLHVIAAGRADALRASYRNWTRTVRASGVGLLLRPSIDLDGDLLGVTLPRRLPAPMQPGRGWLVDRGVTTYCQVAKD